MKGFAQLSWFEMKMYARNYASLFWVLVYPILMLMLFGSMYGNTPSDVTGGHGFIDSYLPALCGLNVLSVAVFTLNINLASYRDSGVLRRFKATPLRPWVVLGSSAGVGVFLVLVSAIEVLVCAKLRWNIDVDAGRLLLLLAFILFGCVCFFSLGFVLSGLAKSVKASNGLAMAVFFPMMFLSGIGMPLSLMPEALQNVSRALPMTYMVDLLQGVWYGGQSSQIGADALVVAGFAVVCALLAVRTFRWE